MIVDLNIRKYGKYVLAVAATAVLGMILSEIWELRTFFLQDKPMMKPEQSVVMETTASESAMPELLQAGFTTALWEEIITSDKLLAEYRMERQRLRGQEKTALQEIIQHTEETSSARAQAAERLLSLMQQEEKELRIEYLLKSSGIGDCAVIWENAEATILLPQLLSTQQQQKIQQQTAKLAGISEEQVNLVMREAEISTEVSEKATVEK